MSSNVQVHVPIPCHENWGSMQPEEQGRFCLTCRKTVVDFTKMNDEKMIGYFDEHRSEKICGRFKETQVASSPAHHPRFTFFRAIATITSGFFLSLLSSCNPFAGQRTLGMIDIRHDNDTTKTYSKEIKATTQIMGDSVITEITGESVFVPEVITLNIDSPYPEHYIMGGMPAYIVEENADTPVLPIKDAQGNR